MSAPQTTLVLRKIHIHQLNTKFILNRNSTILFELFYISIVIFILYISDIPTSNKMFMASTMANQQSNNRIYH